VRAGADPRRLVVTPDWMWLGVVVLLSVLRFAAVSRVLPSVPCVVGGGRCESRGRQAAGVAQGSRRGPEGGGCGDVHGRSRCVQARAHPAGARRGPKDAGLGRTAQRRCARRCTGEAGHGLRRRAGYPKRPVTSGSWGSGRERLTARGLHFMGVTARADPRSWR
jgi:hypothetical protein